MNILTVVRHVDKLAPRCTKLSLTQLITEILHPGAGGG